MIEVEETKFAVNAILVTTHGEIVMQLRDDIPEIVSPGKIGLFGGTVKESETKYAGLKRELYEELEYKYVNAQVEFFGIYKKTKAKDGHDKEIHVYIIHDVDLRELVLHEGKELLIDRLDNFLAEPDKVSPTSYKILQDYKEYIKKHERKY